ncbi:MAG TPA: hypothetical protein VM432_03765 [Bdellovibrionales bacterium]|nr:hypothetical protein [Bdellovibrionales bacterium]
MTKYATFKHDLKTFLGLSATFLGLVALLFVMTACAPNRTEREYKEARTDFSQGNADPELKMMVGGVDPTRLSWTGEGNTAVVLRLARTMIELGQKTERKSLSSLGRRIGGKLYSNSELFTQTEFQNTIYVSAAIGETRKDSAATLSNADEMLDEQSTLTLNLLSSISSRFKWPARGASEKEVFDAAEEFGVTFVKEANRRLDKRVSSGIEKEIKRQFFPVIRDVRDHLESVLQENNVRRLIVGMRKLLETHDFDLSAETEAKLQQVDTIAAHVEALQTKYDALTVLVEIWRVLTPEERIASIQPKSPELYDYLVDKKDKELTCIADRECTSLFKVLQKRLGLYPAIEKYGIDNLKRDITAAILSGVKAEVRLQIADAIPKTASLLGERISKEMSALRGRVQSAQKNYGSFVRGIAKNYADKELARDGYSSRIAGFETDRLNVDIRPGRVELSSKDSRSSVTSGAEAIGTSFGFAGANWMMGVNGKEVSFQKSVISQINKLLAIGGFEGESGGRFKSFAIAMNPSASQRHFYVRDFMQTKDVYFVPDRFRVGSDYTSTAADSRRLDVSVKAQAELLRGLSAMIRFFRDWQEGPFEEGLAKVQLGKYITELPAGDIQQKLFPKETVFSLAVANAASILQNLTRQGSAVFLIDLKGRSKWSDEMKSTEEIAVKAGIVDIIGGERADVVKSADIARFLIAVADFINAIEGIEKTKSPQLTKIREGGGRGVDSLIQARHDLRKLIVGLANFLSNEMQEKDGGLRSTFHRSSVTVDRTESRLLLDQALGMLALARAGEILDNEVYRGAARDVLVFMNTKLWNSDKGFYSVNEIGDYEEPSIGTIAQVLLAGEEIRPLLAPASQSQWDKIADPWYSAFDRL